jgi:hypothetical protein
MQQDEDYTIAPGQPWSVDLFRPADARGVTRLFLSVYGEKYPVKTFLDPDLLEKENRAGRVVSSVARTAAGDVVGHNALFQSAPYKQIYETGAGVVHKDYRGGQGIFTEMVAHGYRVGGDRFGMPLIYAEPVCNHVFSQKLTRKQGNITMAVEVDLMPAAAYAKEGSARGRVASLLDFKTFSPRPHPIYVPPVYADLLGFLYAEFDDEREIQLSHEVPPDSVKTRIDVQYFDFAQVARLAVRQVGPDFPRVFDQEEKKVIDQGATVIQAWMNMGYPWSGRPVEILREQGYFAGGALPRWFDADGLLMMKVRHRPHWEQMQIQYRHAWEITTLIRQEWEKSLEALGSR